MTPAKPIEQVLNDFYINAWTIVEDLTLIDKIYKEEHILSQVERFVKEARLSYDVLQREGYAAAWPHLTEASVGFIGLCRYKDTHLPNVDSQLSMQCAQTYRALPDPKDGLVILNTAKIFERYVQRMEQSYQGQGNLGGKSLERDRGEKRFPTNSLISDIE